MIGRTKNHNDIKVGRKGDILLPLSGETPLDISNSAVLPEDNIALGSDLLVISTQLNSLFLSFQLSSVRKKDIARLAQGKSIVHINPKEIGKLKVYFPELKEQKYISDFLTTLTDKIDLTRQKIDVLKKYKLGLIQKGLRSLYLSNKSIPLFDLLTPFKMKNTDNLPQYTVGKDGLKLIDEIRYDTSNHNVFVNHCFLVGLGIEEIALSKLENGCVSPVYNVFKLKNEDDYLFLNIFIKPILWAKKHYITRKSVRREFEIDMKELQKVRIPYTNDNSIISLCVTISKLDKLVETLEEESLVLSKQKSYLLDNMFI